MTAALSPFPRLQLSDDDGVPLAGGFVYTYESGASTTPQSVYTTAAGNIAHTNPVELDAAGRATIFLGDGLTYRFVVKNAALATIYTVDGIFSFTEAGVQTLITDTLADTITPVLNGGTGADNASDARDNLGIAYPYDIMVAVSDEATTDLTTGTAKITFRMPRAMTLTGVKSSLGDASSSGLVTVDINANGASILSTKLSIDATEKTSATAATPAVISDSSLAADDEITIDIDAAGTDARGLKVYLVGTA
jgi:hypothetical protein